MFSRVYRVNLRLNARRVFSKQEMSDEVAEWLRRWTANPMCSARVGSNPILIVSVVSESTVYAKRFTAMLNIRFSLLLQIVAQTVFQIRILLKVS